MARYRAIMRSAMLKQQLQSAGVPDVMQVWSHEIGASRMLIALAIKQRYAGHAKQVGVLAASCGASVYGCKMVIVVDDDIDVSNLDQLMWAMLSRYDPATSVDILRRMRSTPADPRLTPSKRKVRDFTTRGWSSTRRCLRVARPISRVNGRARKCPQAREDVRPSA